MRKIHFLLGILCLVIASAEMRTWSQIPATKTFAIPTPSGKVVVNNFYTPSRLFSESGAVELTNSESEYQIAFDGLNYYNFFIHLPFEPRSGRVPPGWDFRRKEAEDEFLEILGISKSEACKLKVSVGFAGVHNELAEIYAGVNYGLSFCPNNTPIPRLGQASRESLPKKERASRKLVATRAWPAFWSAFLNASRTRDLTTLVRLSSNRHFNDFGDSTREQWFQGLRKNWPAFQKAVASETQSFDNDGQTILRITKLRWTLVFRFEDDGVWRFIGDIVD